MNERRLFLTEETLGPDAARVRLEMKTRLIRERAIPDWERYVSGTEDSLARFMKQRYVEMKKDGTDSCILLKR